MYQDEFYERISLLHVYTGIRRAAKAALELDDHDLGLDLSFTYDLEDGSELRVGIRDLLTELASALEKIDRFAFLFEAIEIGSVDEEVPASS